MHDMELPVVKLDGTEEARPGYALTDEPNAAPGQDAAFASNASAHRRFVKREARRALFGGAWLPLTFAVTLVMLLSAAVRVAEQSFFGVIELAALTFGELPAAFECVTSYLGDLLYIAVIVPPAVGVSVFATEFYEGGKPPFGVIFNAFGSLRAAVRSYNIFFSYFWRYAVICLLAASGMLASELLHGYLSETGGRSTAAIATVAAVTALTFALGAALTLMTRCFLTLHAAFKRPELTVRAASALSVRLTRGHMREILSLDLSFIGWLLLSIATLGCAAVLWALPYFIMTRTVLASCLWDEGTMGTKETREITEVRSNSEE